MEIKEALEDLKSRLLCAKYVESDYVDSVKFKTIQTAISVLERHIPKTPRTEQIDYDAFDDCCINYYCPTCNRRIVSKDNTGWFAGKPVKYCECGQAIEWKGRGN